MAPAELAIVLSLRPGAVRVRLHRARKALAGDPQMQELITNSARTGPSVALPSQPRRC
jgi:RNA polymerase sigma-70 factor (ECF subfamily)